MISIAEFQLGFFEYVRNEMLPHIDNMSIPFVGGLRLPISKELAQIGFGTVTALADLNIEQYVPMLQMLGIVTDNGMIDVDKVSPILKEEIAKVGFFKIGSFTFKEDDVDVLISYLK